MSLDTFAGGPQRRQFPRIELDAPLTATDLATREDALILDLSHGGLRTLSPTPGHPGSYHSHRAPGVLQRFIVGWRAMPDPTSQASLRCLVTFVTTVASFAEHAPFVPPVFEEGYR